jgi:hypothetical protein
MKVTQKLNTAAPYACYLSQNLLYAIQLGIDLSAGLGECNSVLYPECELMYYSRPTIHQHATLPPLFKEA